MGVEYTLEEPGSRCNSRRKGGWTIKNSDRQCPCGCGRCYHECCGKPEKVVSLAQVKWRRASAELRRKLGEFAEEVVFLREAASAQEVYFAQLDEDLQALDDDLVIERCFEWFIFDYPLSSGQSLIELFVEVCGPKLPFTQAMLLVLWQEARSSFFEVKAIYPGKGVALEHLVSGKKVYVRERGVRDDIVPGSVLYVRLLKVGEEHEFSTSAIGVAAAFKAELADWLKKDFQKWKRARRPGEDRTWNSYLRLQAHRLNGHIIRLGLGLSAPVPFWGREGGSAAVPTLLSFLQGDTLRQACATNEGREQVEELLRLIQGAEEIRKVRRFLRTGRSRPAPGMPRGRGFDGFAWPEETYAEVASQITSGLENLGYSREDTKSMALRLWHDFCCLERPHLRKPPAWTAAVIYAAIHREGRKKVSQHRLARLYGVSASSVSNNFRRLCQALPPQRGVPMPSTELMKIEPLIHRILHDLKS